MHNKRIFYTLFLLLMLFTLAFQSLPGSPAGPSADAPKLEPQSTPVPLDEQFTPGAPPLSLTIILACMCLAFLGVIGVIILGIFVRRENTNVDSESPKE